VGKQLATFSGLPKRALVRGIGPDAVLPLVSVQWFGSEAFELT